MTKRRSSLRVFAPRAEFYGQRPPKPEKPKKKDKHYWVCLDGEGTTHGEAKLRPDERCALTGSEHRYISMSWRRENGQGDSISGALDGITGLRHRLSTRTCLEFILSIPEDAKIMGYGTGYDLTKILEDIPDELLYMLTHPETRAYTVKTETGSRTNHRPVMWRPTGEEGYGYALDMFNTRFKVGRLKLSPKGYPVGYGYRTIHDLSRFYQAPFVKACKNWSVGTPKERNTMRAMKKDRRNLARYSQEEILQYSDKECQWGSELAQKLDDACESVGIDLRGQYFGAGSIAKALLRKWQIKAQMPTMPAPLVLLAQMAFFGGRFELSVRGVVRRLVHDWDISAAYPYQIARLPCLQCGKWSKTTDVDRVRVSQAALVNYRLDPWRGALPAWGPFPFRDKDGSIPFPIESAGGWLHKDEFLAGAKLFPNVRFLGAWVYETSCDHQPFADMPKIYLERLRLGKEGAGMILKYGTNAVAGNIMQLIGTKPFYQPVWAGMITSGTRAQLLEMLGQHEKWSDVIMMATDGLWGLAEVTAPKPVDTGTDVDVLDESKGKTVRKPLGAWEHERFEEGVFMARPGIYFPLGMPGEVDEEDEADDDKVKDLKARGIGIRTLFKHADRILEHYEQTLGKEPYVIGDEDPLSIIRTRSEPQGVERFIGLRGGILRNVRVDPTEVVTLVKTDSAGNIVGSVKKHKILSITYKRREEYGRWSLQHRIIDFSALPKREEGNGRDLEVRRMPTGQLSKIYEKGDSEAAIEDKLAEINELGHFDDDQPDWTE